MAAVRVGSMLLPCAQTPQGAAVYLDRNGRSQYVSKLSSRDKAQNQHVFDPKTGKASTQWVKSLPLTGTRRMMRTNYSNGATEEKKETKETPLLLKVPEEKTLVQTLHEAMEKRLGQLEKGKEEKDEDEWSDDEEEESYSRAREQALARRVEQLERKVTTLETDFDRFKTEEKPEAKGATTKPKPKEEAKPRPPAPIPAPPQRREPTAAELEAERKERIAKSAVEIKNLTAEGKVRAIGRQRPLPSGGTLGNIYAYKLEHKDVDVFNDEDQKGADASDQFYTQYGFGEQIRSLIVDKQPLMIMMYGSSGSGKTFTTSYLLRRFAHEILTNPRVDFIRICYLDVYQANIYNLLYRYPTTKSQLEKKGVRNVPYFSLTEAERKEVDFIRGQVKYSTTDVYDRPAYWIESNKCVEIRDSKEIDALDRFAQRLRVVTPTRANPSGSSRSHLFIRLQIFFKDEKQASLYLVDLAGSEDYDLYNLKEFQTETNNRNLSLDDLDRLKAESKRINESLGHIPIIIEQAGSPTGKTTFATDQRFERLLQKLLDSSTLLTIIGTITPDRGPILAKGHGVGQYDRETKKTLEFLSRMRTLRLGGRSASGAPKAEGSRSGRIRWRMR